MNAEELAAWIAGRRRRPLCMSYAAIQSGPTVQYRLRWTRPADGGFSLWMSATGSLTARACAPDARAEAQAAFLG